MIWSWFDLNWPWIGAGAAVVLLVLLLGTQRLRSDLALSRWRDLVWLAWLAAPIYMIHNVEEYGIDLQGRRHEFPDTLCKTLNLGAYPACPVPPAFFLAVNLSLIWVTAPLAGFLSRRHPMVGLTFYGLLFTNGMTHIVPMVLGRGYNPGALTAVTLFLPGFFWVASQSFGSGRIPRLGLGVIVGAGALVHLVLIGSIFAFIGGRIDASILVFIQVLNAGLFLALPWIPERKLLG